jgi:hypothetical protein
VVIRNGHDHLVLQQYVLPVVFLLAAHIAVCGTYLVYGPSSSAVRRFYDANMVLSARRFRRRRWTIVTHFFAHLDALHLVVNMLSIYSFGGGACQMLGNAGLQSSIPLPRSARSALRAGEGRAPDHGGAARVQARREWLHCSRP